MNQPCKGCGHPLQHTHPLNKGFTPKSDAEYCQSCFRYKHYKDSSLMKREKPEQSVSEVVGLVLWCVDSMYPAQSFTSIDRAWLNHDFILVLTKFDVYPTHLWHTRLEQIQKLCLRHSIHPRFMVPFSKHLPWTKEHIIQAMKASHQTSFACIGQVNTGKSSLINALVNENSVVTSPFAHTTQAKIPVPFGEYTLIDYPGFDEKQHVYDTLDHEIVELIHVHQLIKPITFALKRHCVIVIDGVAMIECIVKETASITLYMGERVQAVKRNPSVLATCTWPLMNTFVGSCDIEITHVGWIHAVGEVSTFKVYTYPSLQVKVTKDALCW